MNNAAPGWTPATVSGHTPASSSDGEIDLSEFISQLWRKKWLIALIAAVFTVAGILLAVNSTKYYDATASLILKPQEAAAIGVEDIFGGISADDAELNSQIEVIKSRNIVGQVVSDLKLYEDSEFIGGDASTVQVAVQWLKSSIMSLAGSGDRGSGQAQSLSPQEKATDTLISKLRISVIPKTHVFRIRLETESAEKSVLIVNNLAQAFINDQIDARVEQTSASALWLGKKVTDLGETLAATEQRAAEYRINTERNVTEADVASSNLSLKNARGRLSSFLKTLQNQTGTALPRTQRDEQRIASLREDVARYEEIVAKQTADLLTIRQLDREAVAAGTIYEHFLKRLNEIEVQKGLQVSDVRVLSPAVPRYEATKPRRTMMVLVAGMLGLLLGSAFVILRRFMDRSFQDPADLQQAFGIPVIGAIPRASASHRRGILSYALKRPSSGIMESIRDLRTSLMFNKTPGVEGRGHVLTMTSSIPGEGKTTSSILLAVNTVALNKRVLLIECDLRRSTFQSYFGRQTTLGLVDAISGENLKDAIWTEPTTGADIIFGGRAGGQNAADIFASSEFEEFLELMRTEYDLVILDSPPVLPVPDARLIAKVSDSVVYMVHASSTPSSTVAAGLRLFDNIGVKVDGLSLTQMRKGSGYGGYGYSQGSKYYQN